MLEYFSSQENFFVRKFSAKSFSKKGNIFLKINELFRQDEV